MAGQERILEIAQAGLETTRGTAVAATRKVYMALAPWTYERELMWATNTTGTFEARRDGSYRRPVIGFTGSEDLSYEDTAWWMQSIIKGTVAGVGDAGSPIGYTYTFVPTLAADDIKSMSLEYGTPTLPYKSNQVMVNSATLRCEPDTEASWKLDVELMARKPTQAAMTGSIAERARELISAPGTALSIDNAGVAAGTTPVTGRFIGGSITINNNLNFKAFAEDIDDYAANKVGRDAREVDAQFSFEFDSDAEYANYRTTGAPVERVIQLAVQGSIISGAFRKLLTIDLTGFWTSVESGYRETNKILTFGLQARYNTTLARTIRVVVKNALITLP